MGGKLQGALMHYLDLHKVPVSAVNPATFDTTNSSGIGTTVENLAIEIVDMKRDEKVHVTPYEKE